MTDKEEFGDINFEFGEKTITVKERRDVAEKFAKIMNLDNGLLNEEFGENLLWKAEEKKGLFKKPKTYMITNYRIQYLDSDKEFLQMPIKYLDIVVMNSHRESSRNGVGAFASGMGGFVSSGESVTVGDVNFLVQGNILLTIPNVIDPTGLKSLINQVKKQMNEN